MDRSARFRPRLAPRGFRGCRSTACNSELICQRSFDNSSSPKRRASTAKSLVIRAERDPVLSLLQCFWGPHLRGDDGIEITTAERSTMSYLKPIFSNHRAFCIQARCSTGDPTPLDEPYTASRIEGRHQRRA